MQWCGTCSLPQSQHELQLLQWLASGHRVWSDQWNKATTECTGKSDVFLACLAASKAKVSLSRAYWKQLGRNLFHRDFTLENMFETVRILHLIGTYQIPFKIFWFLSASKPKYNFGHWSKMTLKLSSYLLPKFSRVPFTIVLISGISTMVNGTLLNFGKRHEDDLRVILDQWPKLHLGLDVLLLNLVSVSSFLWNLVVCPGWFVALLITTSHDMQDKVY